MTDTLTPTELEAAEAEGVVTLPAELLETYTRFLANQSAKAVLEEQLEKDKATLGGYLETNHLQGFTFNGKVKVRRSEVNTARVDAKRLKDELPAVWTRFMRVTKSVRISILA